MMPSARPSSAKARSPSRAPGSSRSQSAASANSLSRCSCTSSRWSSGVADFGHVAVEVRAPSRRPVELVVVGRESACARVVRTVEDVGRSGASPARANAPRMRRASGTKKTPPTSSSTAFGRAGNGCGTASKPIGGAPARLVPLTHMEFRRINALPPYAFAQIDALKMSVAASRRGRRRPRVRQSRPAVARRRGREAHRGGAQPAQPPLLDEQGHPEAARGRRRALRAQVRRDARLRDRGVLHDRCEGGLLAPDARARRPRRHRARAVAVVPDPHLGPDPRRRGRALRAHGAGAELLREPAQRVRAGVAAAARASSRRSRTTRRPRASTSSS